MHLWPLLAATDPLLLFATPRVFGLELGNSLGPEPAFLFRDIVDGQSLSS